MTNPTAIAPINSFVGKGQQIWNANSGIQPYIFNNDTVNNLYVGSKRDVLTGNVSNCIPVFPLGGASWPDVDIWAFAPAPVNYLILPGASSFAPSPVQVQIALNAAGLATLAQQINQNTAIPANIATTGAPLLNLKNIASASQVTTNVAGTNTVRGPFVFSQISYEIAVSVECNTAPVGATVVDITLAWTDSTSGLDIKRKSFQIVAGSNGSPHKVEINGPARADTLNVTIANNASSGTDSKVTMTVLQSSRDYAEDSFRTVVFQQAGFTAALPKLDYNVLGQFGGSLGAGASATRLMAAYSGPAHLTGNTAGNNIQLQVAIAEASTATPLLTGDPDCLFVQSDTAGFINESFLIPNIQQVMIINNSDVSARIINLAVIAENQIGD